MANYALAKDKVIVNVIVADAEFIELIKADYDEVIEIVEGLDIGMGYTKVKTKWVAPAQEVVASDAASTQGGV